MNLSLRWLLKTFVKYLPYTFNKFQKCFMGTICSVFKNGTKYCICSSSSWQIFLNVMDVSFMSSDAPTCNLIMCLHVLCPKIFRKWMTPTSRLQQCTFLLWSRKYLFPEIKNISPDVKSISRHQFIWINTFSRRLRNAKIKTPSSRTWWTVTWS